jgi:hypothetical protein
MQLATKSRDVNDLKRKLQESYSTTLFANRIALLNNSLKVVNALDHTVDQKFTSIQASSRQHDVDNGPNGSTYVSSEQATNAIESLENYLKQGKESLAARDEAAKSLEASQMHVTELSTKEAQVKEAMQRAKATLEDNEKKLTLTKLRVSTLMEECEILMRDAQADYEARVQGKILEHQRVLDDETQRANEKLQHQVAELESLRAEITIVDNEIQAMKDILKEFEGRGQGFEDARAALEKRTTQEIDALTEALQRERREVAVIRERSSQAEKLWAVKQAEEEASLLAEYQQQVDVKREENLALVNELHNMEKVFADMTANYAKQFDEL